MEETYINLLNKFRKLEIEEKQTEILNELYGLLSLLYFENKKSSIDNSALGILKKYSNESEYLDAVFSCIISLKEENAKLIKQIENL